MRWNDCFMVECELAHHRFSFIYRSLRLSEDKLEIQGTVIESSKGIFRVKLENNHVVIGHLSGKMKMYKIRVLPGDTVTVEISPYDLKRGRIVRREKNVS